MSGYIKFEVTIPFEDGFKLDIKGSTSKYRPADTNPDSPGFGPAEGGGVEEIDEIKLVAPNGDRIELPETLDQYLHELSEDGRFDEPIMSELKRG